MPEMLTVILKLVSTAIFIPINALILWVVLKLFKLAENKFMLALKVAALSGVILFVVSLILDMVYGGLGLVSPDDLSGAGLATLAGLAIFFFFVSLAIAFAVNTFLVKKFYSQETKKALLISLVWVVVSLIVGLLVGAIIVAITIAIIIGTGAAGSFT